MGIETKLGQILTGDPVGRDAVHVAIIEVVADHFMPPGEPVGLVDGIDPIQPVVSSDMKLKRVGIIDPFLPQPVKKGQRCFLWLYPGTVTGMRHHWSHPAFADGGENSVAAAIVDDEKAAAISWMHEQAKILGCDFIDLVGDNSDLVSGGYIRTHENENARDHWYDIQDEFWEKRKLITGEDVPDDKRGGFTCSC